MGVEELRARLTAIREEIRVVAGWAHVTVGLPRFGIELASRYLAR